MEFLKKMDHKALGLGSLVLAAILLLSIVILSNATIRGARLDLTVGRLFTLSDGTRQVLGSLDEPITVRLYFSKFLGQQSPPHASYFGRVRDLLEQYVDLSGGKLRLEVINPEPFSDQEDRAVGFGLQGVPIDAATGDLGYFGIAATNSTDDQSVIAFMNPEREPFIEYDLTKMVHGLAKPKKKVVGMISTLPIDGGFLPRYGQTPPWLIMQQIRDFFEVRDLSNEKGKTIPEDVDILMVVQPSGVDQDRLYAIDQFVLKGGRALVFVDPHAESQPQMGPVPLAPDLKGFGRLLKAWGVDLADGKVAADIDAARRVDVGQGGRPVIADYVLWLALNKRNFDTGDVVTAETNQLNLATAGVLEKAEGGTTEIRPLIFTGNRSMRMEAGEVRTGPIPDVVKLFRNFRPNDKELMLAARITGTVKSAFPDGPPKAEEKPVDAADADKDKAADSKKEAEKKDEPTEKLPPHVAASSGPINVIVVTDADLLNDNYWARTRDFFGQKVTVPIANNADFVVSSLDNLAGSDALIGLRARAVSARPFHLVEEIRRDAEQRFRTKEEELRTKLTEVQGKLDKLMKREDASGGEVLLSADEKASIERFRLEMLSIRKELRDVQRALRSDIEGLDALLKFVNIGLIPLLLGVGTVVYAVVRWLRRRGARATA